MPELVATKFVHYSFLKASDDELRKFPTIGIAYGFNTYACDLELINALKECIKHDFPNIADKDIDVWFISHTYSNIHARQTMLKISIPVEEFIKMRKAGKIHIL